MNSSVITKPWWFGELTRKHTFTVDKIQELTRQMNALRSSMENWKIEWHNISAKINSIYNENVELLVQRDEAFETIEVLKRQLNLRGKMIEELRGFLDQETLNRNKWDKKHEEVVIEITNRKKKAKITSKK